MSNANNFLHLDEKNHVEEPFLTQLHTMPGLHWDILHLAMGSEQTPAETQRETFDQVLMRKDLETALKKINPWINEAQLFEAITDLTSFEGDNLYKNNQAMLERLRKGTKVQVEGGPGEEVQFIDFDQPKNNIYTAVSQMKFRIPGTDRHFYPDIVCFINGIPVAVIECKSPRAKEPIPEAIDQLMRYAEQREYAREGSKLLFTYNQFIIATCRNRAKFGTITTSIEKHFYRWTDPFPATLENLADYCKPQQHYFTDKENTDDEELTPEQRTTPNDQQRLVHGMLKPENLLSIIRSFTVWSVSDDGKMIKVVGRYQQFRAVKKTVERLLTGKNRDERGGIIWHTQGSGKSLTMVFLIREMYLHTALQSYKVILLTDRTQLDEQIKQTAAATGYTINDPSTISQLKTVLKTDTAEIVSAMIHKFQEREYSAIFPVLNKSDKVLILTDEAHRTQYSNLGSNLDNALPNATRIAFTGTPIGKTEATFGDYIDKYTMRQAIEDGVTLEIVYEGRTHSADIDDTDGADKKFQDVFKDYNTQEQVEALAYGTRRAYLESEDTIREKARDMLKHYAEHVFSNGYKAQVVAVSKEAAHRYSLAFAKAHAELLAEWQQHNPYNLSLENFAKLETAVVISDGSHNDAPHLKDYADSKNRKLATEGFKLKFGNTQKLDESGEKVANGNTGILIVVDMLLTGFDAPIEQVMYLDKVIVNHNLLQAIARVNRVYDDKKTVGFVVDYVGMGNHLKRALDAYWEKEQQEITGCLLDTTQLIAELKAAKEKLNGVLTEHGLSAYDDPDDIFNLLADDDIRHDFTEAYQAFAKALDNIFPRKEALEFLPDLNRFSQINVQASQYFRDQRMSMKGVSEKLRKVTDEFLKSKGIDIKIEPISIMDDKFFENVKTIKREKSRAAATEHAIREIINISMDEDQELYASFSEELRRILLELKDNWEEIYKQLEELRQRIKKAQTENTYGLNRKLQMPIYRKLHAIVFDKKENLTDDEINTLVIHTKEIYGMLKTELSLIGFWASNANVAKLKGEIQNYIASTCSHLPAAFKRRSEIAQEILAWAKDDRITSAIQYAEQ